MFSDGQCWYREIKLFLFSRACTRHDGLYSVSERIEKLRQSSVEAAGFSAVIWFALFAAGPLIKLVT